MAINNINNLANNRLQNSGSSQGVATKSVRNSVAVAMPRSAAPLASGLPDFRPLVERYGPAVVNVSVSANVRSFGGPMVPGAH